MLQVPGDDPAELLLEQLPVDAGSVLETTAGDVTVAESDPRAGLDEPGDASWREEHLGPHRSAEEHVVVGIQEVLAESRNVVQLAFDGVRVVGGQVVRV